MKKTGQLLKDKRESVNLSISEVALATKINPKILTAIENGDEAGLPAKTFLKGFIRSYSVYLKMDVDEVLRSFTDETGGPPPERVHEAYKKPEASAPATAPRKGGRVDQENSSGLRTAAVVVIVILIGLIIGVRELIEKYQREKVIEGAENFKISPLVQPPMVLDPLKSPETPPKPDGLKPDGTAAGTSATPVGAESASGSSASAAPTPTAEPSKATDSAASPPVAPATAAATPTPVAAANPVANVKPEAHPAPLPTPPPAPPPAPTPVAKPEPVPERAVDSEEPKSAIKNVRNEIILEALDKVDVQFKIDGETKRVSLGATEVHTIHSDQPVIFDFSDGGAVNIILNGHERGTPGDLGKPKQITIP